LKKIEAMIPPFRLDSVKAALDRHNLREFVVARVDVDEPDETPDEPRWSSYLVKAFTPSLRIELTVVDGIATSIAHTIFRAARARHMARTSVIILPLEQLIEIDTGARMT
jgi:nitrogen regulatory protein P-II 1